MRKLTIEALRNPYSMEYLMGVLLFEEGNGEEALVRLKGAEKTDVTRPDLCIKLGDVYFKIGRLVDARQSYQKALKMDRDNPEAYLGLSQCNLLMKRNTKAVETAVKSLGSKYHNPRGHFLLGTALHRIGRVHLQLYLQHPIVSRNKNDQYISVKYFFWSGKFPIHINVIAPYDVWIQRETTFLEKWESWRYELIESYLSKTTPEGTKKALFGYSSLRRKLLPGISIAISSPAKYALAEKPRKDVNMAEVRRASKWIFNCMLSGLRERRFRKDKPFNTAVDATSVIIAKTYNLKVLSVMHFYKNYIADSSRDSRKHRR